MDKTLGKVPCFTGKTNDWLVFCEQLDQYCDLNDINVNKKVGVLISCLGIKVYKILRDLCHPVLPKDKKYVELIELLKKHYCIKKSLFRERTKFYCAKQLRGESITLWITRLKKLAVDCRFEEDLEKILLDRFVTGMRNGRVFERICEENEIRNLQYLVDIAILKETTLKDINDTTTDTDTDTDTDNMCLRKRLMKGRMLRHKHGHGHGHRRHRSRSDSRRRSLSRGKSVTRGRMGHRGRSWSRGRSISRGRSCDRVRSISRSVSRGRYGLKTHDRKSHHHGVRRHIRDVMHKDGHKCMLKGKGLIRHRRRSLSGGRRMGKHHHGHGRWGRKFRKDDIVKTVVVDRKGDIDILNTTTDDSDTENEVNITLSM